MILPNPLLPKGGMGGFVLVIRALEFGIYLPC
jgi:hypothetical protein